MKFITIARRNTATRITACLLAFLILVGLYQHPGAAASQAQAPDPALGFTAAMGTDAAGLDPALTSDGNSLLVTSQIFETLVNFGPGGSIPQPSLATSWSASPNNMTWTFSLRQGVKFQDGTDFDASAVAFNLNRWWDPSNPYHHGSFDSFGNLFGGFKGDATSLISSINVIDASHLAVTLAKSHSSIISMLATPPFAIASPASIQAGTLLTTPVGTGPFSFGSRVLADHILLTANTTYWGGKPAIDTLSFKVIPDNDARYAALVNNTVQAVGDLSESYALQAYSNADLKVLWKPATDTGYLGMNRARPPLNNLLVRQAISHAINRQHLVALTFGPGDQVATQLLPPDMWGFNPDIPGDIYNPTLAHDLLTQAGYTHGVTTTLVYRDVYRAYMPNPAAEANAIKADLQAVGITVTLQLLDPATLINTVFSGNADLFLLGWMGDYPHPENFLSPNLCGTYLAFGPTGDTTLCSLLEDTQAVSDFNTQLANYQSASMRVNDTLPMLPISHGRSALILRKVVAGVNLSVGLFENYRFAFNAPWSMYLPMIKK